MKADNCIDCKYHMNNSCVHPNKHYCKHGDLWRGKTEVDPMEIIDKYIPVEEIRNRTNNTEIIYCQSEKASKEKWFGFQKNRIKK